ncbi:kinase-like domain-containing protein, partial [Ganoderma leucocontextum]
MAAPATSFPDFTGGRVHGRYELVSFLGSGTFGVVYKAIDYDTDRQFVAVKIMRKAGRSDAELAVIKREVALHHVVSDTKSIVGLIDAFDDHEWCYIVLEFCPGGDLFRQIVDKECYFDNDKRLRQAFLSLVDAVQACHDAEIAHRDLKPENILTSEDGSELYLADFGLAANEKMVGDFGSGTHVYMSPECIGEMTAMQPYDPFLSDIWALGVILINMISGSHPWTQATTGDVHFRRFLKDPDFLYKVLPMSAGAHTIIRETLSLQPAQRISLHNLREAIL